MTDGAARPDYSLTFPDSVGGHSGSAATTRLPLEYSFALDSICASFDPDDRVYVSTDSPSLLQAMVNRHGRLVAHTAVCDGLQSPTGENIDTIEGPDALSTPVDRVVILGPARLSLIRETVSATAGRCRHDCLVGNPYSFNRVEDRTVGVWLSPIAVLRAYKQHGYDTDVIGYHGPRSIAQSLVGRVWQSLGRPDKRDVYTHRMRDRYREETVPLAMLSCLVYVQARPEAGDA